MRLFGKSSPYFKSGRLADVIAAVQIMGRGKRPEGKIDRWAEELSGSSDKQEVIKWTEVFQEHPEFFLVYTLDGDKKAALRLRYTNKTYDSEKGIDYTPEQLDRMTPDERKLLTTKPLTSEDVVALTNTAIELHNRAIAEASWFVPVLTGGLSFVGALAGALIK